MSASGSFPCPLLTFAKEDGLMLTRSDGYGIWMKPRLSLMRLWANSAASVCQRGSGDQVGLVIWSRTSRMGRRRLGSVRR
jgi:hypothetical protein